MSIKGKKYPFYLFFIPLLIIFTIAVLVNFTGAVSGPVKVLTETDFVQNSALFALPEDEIVAVFLESPLSGGEPNDTGIIGLDVIPYEYEKEIVQTFCWDDDNPDAEHYMTLLDNSGKEVLTVFSGGECVTETIAEGDYEMRVMHDGKSDKRVAVFIVPEGEKSLLTTASDETLLNLTSVLNSDKCIGCDLSNVNLSSADLSGVDLTDSILNNAILVDADLSGANLEGAQLQNADLSRANLKGANLSGADLTSAILINADLSDADLTLANLENADTQGAKLGGATGVLIAEPDETDIGSENVSKVHMGAVMTITCAGGAIAMGTGEDLEVTGACTVGAGTYQYRNVNIHSGGSLTFDDAVIDFWAYGIIVEKDGSLIAGSEAAPIGMAGGKLTIHLYGEAQPVGGSGVPCKTPTSATVEVCGIPKTVWDSNGANKVCLPPEEGGTPGTCKPEDYFYQYKPLPQDGGDMNAFFGYKVLGVSYGGTLRLFGKKGSTFSELESSDSGMSWARLDGSINKGATQLKVDKPVDWAVGDRIVVTTTDYLPGHSEVLEIIAPAVDTMTFNFKVVDQFTGADIPGGLQYPHNGKPYEIDSGIAGNIGWETTVDGNPAAETRAAVGLLSRSIMIVSAGDIFNSDFPPVAGNHLGGHTIVRQGVKEFKVQGVQFHQLGQGGKMGHYPAHFHLTRKMPEGTFIKDSSITDSMTRWITLHGAQGVTLARNVGCMSIGHGFYLEDGTEINNKLYSNLGILARAAVKNAQNPREVPGILAWDGRTVPFLPFNSDIYNPTVFWIMNGWNDFEYNMAAGATGCGVCYWLLPGTNSGPSQGMMWEGYASMQSGPMMTEGDQTYQVNMSRAAMTPLKTFKGNYCTSAMMSFNTVGATDTCLGLNVFGTATNPNNPVPAELPVDLGGKGDPNKETFYPKMLGGGGGRFATICPGTDETRDCGPSAVTNRCDVGAARENCAVTVLDKYTSSFHWPQQNFAAIWLRPQWYLYINSFLSDTQNGGLGFVTGGDYTLGNIVPGQWQLATKSVFVGQTQKDNPLTSEAGPFNPLTSSDGMIKGLVCDSGDANHCRLAAEGISMPIDNFAVNQRLFNIYDGPNYQDSNAFLDIEQTDLGSICSPPEDMSATGVSKCPQFGPGVGMPAWMYTRTIGIPVDKTADKCVLPNAAIGWKQPNGFYYPPAFHSRNLHFDNVDIRHYVLEPLWAPGSYDTIEAEVRENYCTFPTNNMFGNFSSVDRQTVVNDNDGSLTGLLSPVATSMGETISVNLDPFFNAPIEAIECESFDTAKTSPYEYITTVVYPGCATNGTCLGVCSNNAAVKCSSDPECGPGNTCSATWGRPCSNAECYGVPLERQLLTTEDASDLSTTGIRMAGMSLFQRSMMTLNGATYYIDTTVSEAEQRKSAKSLNVFKAGETYYVFFIYPKESTNQTYQIYVGESGFNEGTDVSFVRAELRSPIIFTPKTFDNEKNLPAGWDKNYDPGTGILTVTADMKVFESDLTKAKNDFCQPNSFCTLKGDKDDADAECICSDDLTGDQKTQCETGNICGRWAGKDIDCPEGGCPGFSFKLPPAPGFVADNKGNILEANGGHRPRPMCFPQEAPWTADFIRADMDVAGSCKTTPIDNSKFCTDPPGGGGGMPPDPDGPPVGGGADKDGDGEADDTDVDSDNDGIPNSSERSNFVITSSSESASRAIVIPADPDGDGIPNELDLDSDGDCIPDHFEAGGTNDADRDGLVDNFADVDGDGHHDAHDTDQGGSALPLHDTDGDEVPDFLDHDSDGDGMTDTEETGGTVDNNDDGIHDDTEDANNDGLADSLHPDTGNICVIQDTDGDGLPDHLDVVSQTPDDGDDTGDGSTGNGACALASSEVGSQGLAGLAVFALIPLAVVFRRKLRAGKKR